MTDGEYRQGGWDASRVLDALGSIGYSPAAAILDIVDNSVSYGGTSIDVWLHTEKEKREGPGRRRTLISEVEIIDNGWGMDEEGLSNAIQLGSPPDAYDQNTLSKFGMGLKSASSSLGRRLEVSSRGDDGKVRTAILDHDIVLERGAYVFELRDATDDETERLDQTAEGNTGTLVRIRKIRQENLPSPAEILQALTDRAGVIYFYRLAGQGYPEVSMRIDGEPVTSIDPLFEGEADEDLDELNWNGTSVSYIQRPQPIQLTEDGSITATVTMTQLPHPPTAADEWDDMTQKEVRDKYLIGAGNYGFYIYRNGRLISWADALDMVRLDQDLYSFRGRLQITTAADDVLNLNVSKSRIELSDIARDQLTPLLTEGIKKSAEAWGTASSRLQSRLSQTPHDDINEQLDRIGDLEERDDEIDEEASPEDEQERLRERRRKTSTDKPATEDETKKLRESGQRVQYVDMLENNQLWERAHDATHGLIVRVNRSHRLFRDLVESQPENGQLIRIFDIVVYGLARGEYELVYKSDFDADLVERLLDEYRERVGGVLSEVVRRLDLASLLGI